MKTPKKESISDIIAKSTKTQPSYDPKLIKMFSNPSPIPPTPQTKKIKKDGNTSPISNINPNTGDLKKEERKITTAKKSKYNHKEIKLSHKEAASIRLQAKLNSLVAENKKNPTVPQKRKRYFDVESKSKTSTSSPPSPPKKRKKQDSAVDIIAQDSNTSVTEAEVTKNSSDKTHAELNAPKEKDPDLESRTVFVGNIPKEITKKSKIKSIFSQYGTIESIRLRGGAPSKPTLLKKIAFYRNSFHPDSSSIMAYIRFESRKEAKKAVKELKGFELNDHILTVDMADNKKHDNKKAVFIGNLDLRVKDDELRSFFSECGEIDSVRAVRDSATGMGKGFGYVNFKNMESVQLALKLDGKVFKGRQLRVKQAVKKEKGKTKVEISKKQNRNQNNQNQVKEGNQSKTLQRKATVDSKTSKTKKKESFTGDCLSEIGKLKRKQKKPNKGELKKARIVEQLTGVKSKIDFIHKRKKENKKRNN